MLPANSPSGTPKAWVCDAGQDGPWSWTAVGRRMRRSPCQRPHLPQHPHPLDLLPPHPHPPPQTRKRRTEKAPRRRRRKQRKRRRKAPGAAYPHPHPPQAPTRSGSEPPGCWVLGHGPPAHLCPSVPVPQDDEDDNEDDSDGQIDSDMEDQGAPLSEASEKDSEEGKQGSGCPGPAPHPQPVLSRWDITLILGDQYLNAFERCAS